MDSKEKQKCVGWLSRFGRSLKDEKMKVQMIPAGISFHLYNAKLKTIQHIAWQQNVLTNRVDYGKEQTKIFRQRGGPNWNISESWREESRAPFNNKEIRQIPIDDISVAPGEDFWLNV